MTPPALAEELLPDSLLTELRERAAVYDRENRFFDEDLAALRDRGYLRLLVPRELGGMGASLLDASRVQRRLAQAAPATALAMTMHLVATGAALHAHRLGAESARPLLEDAAGDLLFAVGVSEAGNDAMLFDAMTRAVPQASDGAVAFTGRKIFTSLAPAWERLVVHGKRSEGDEEHLVFAVLERSEEVRTREDWDTHGMRATQSRTTELDGALSRRIITETPVGPNQDPFAVGVFAAFELLIPSVYTGIAERAIEIGVEVARSRRSTTRGLVHADDPDIRRRLAAAAIATDGAVLQLEKLSADVDALRADTFPAGTSDHGPRLFLQLSGLKHRVTEAAIAAVDQVVRASGGAHFSRTSELERLSRDVRAGIYHPSDEESVHSSYARSLLGEIGEPR